MVAFAFNAQQYQPSYGGDAGLPDGVYDTVIIKSERKDVEKMGVVTGSYLELTHAVIEGPLKGQTQVDRLNLLHSNPQTVEIANKQLSAYCHVLGVFMFQDTQQLHNIPMKIEVGRQIDKNTKQPTTYGEIKKIYDRNGNAPGKAGNGPVMASAPQPTAPPPAGVAPEGGGWNGGGQPQQPQQQGGFGQQPQQPQGGFGQPDPNAGGGQPQGGNWGAPAPQSAHQPQGAGWGAPAPQQPPQGGGWSPDQGGTGVAPAWGQR